jgi:hypothetical protein
VPTFDEIEQPGDYSGPHPVTLSGGAEGRVVWFMLPLHEGETKFDRPTPGSGIHGVYEPPWEFRECPDGSLEVRASIACGRGSKDGEYWHGYLDEGHQWRQV